MYLALPPPYHRAAWLIPTLIGVLLVPTVVSHRMGSVTQPHSRRDYQLDHHDALIVGILLVRGLPAHRESAPVLLRSGAELG